MSLVRSHADKLETTILEHERTVSVWQYTCQELQAKEENYKSALQAAHAENLKLAGLWLARVL
jgi:hypothetical protein